MKANNLIRLLRFSLFWLRRADSDSGCGLDQSNFRYPPYCHILGFSTNNKQRFLSKSSLPSRSIDKMKFHGKYVSLSLRNLSFNAETGVFKRIDLPSTSI